jgi:hypothetical protein
LSTAGLYNTNQIPSNPEIAPIPVIDPVTWSNRLFWGWFCIDLVQVRIYNMQWLASFYF